MRTARNAAESAGTKQCLHCVCVALRQLMSEFRKVQQYLTFCTFYLTLCTFGPAQYALADLLLLCEE